MYNASSLPTIIFAIIGITILAGIVFSPVVGRDAKPFAFAISIIALTTWLMIIHWYCSSNNVLLGWFFLLLPFGILLMWYISKWLHRATFQLDI